MLVWVSIAILHYNGRGVSEVGYISWVNFISAQLGPFLALVHLSNKVHHKCICIRVVTIFPASTSSQSPRRLMWGTILTSSISWTQLRNCPQQPMQHLLLLGLHIHSQFHEMMCSGYVANWLCDYVNVQHWLTKCKYVMVSIHSIVLRHDVFIVVFAVQTVTYNIM